MGVVEEDCTVSKGGGGRVVCMAMTVESLPIQTQARRERRDVLVPARETVTVLSQCHQPGREISTSHPQAHLYCYHVHGGRQGCGGCGKDGGGEGGMARKIGSKGVGWERAA